MIIKKRRKLPKKKLIKQRNTSKNICGLENVESNDYKNKSFIYDFYWIKNKKYFKKFTKKILYIMNVLREDMDVEGNEDAIKI